MGSENVVAIVIAKQFSARLHRKNMADLCGKPVVEWSFIQAAACDAITHIVFVTDDHEMGELAKEYTPHIVYQDPTRTLPHVASGWAATIEGIQYFEKAVGEIGILVSLLPTSPLKQPDDLHNLVWMYRKWRAAKGCKLVQPVIRVHEMTLHVDVGDSGMMQLLTMWGVKQRFLNTACIGWNAIDPRAYKETWDTTKYDDPLIYYELEPWQGFDIDRQVDLDIVRTLFRKYILDRGGYGE